MELTAYLLTGHDVAIRPAPLEREWMDASPERFAYRCLPLNIANAHGWEILCPSSFKAVWNGRPHIDDIRVYPKEGTVSPALSHFGSGILTFHVTCLMRTEPGYGLFVQGPVNRPKDGIAALTGIIETDWAPYSFTMNWKFTRPGTVVTFERGEPFCHFFPLKRGEVETFSPRIMSIADDPDLKRRHDAWTESRGKFVEDLRDRESKANEEKWQKMYYRGVDVDGDTIGAPDHQTKVRVKPFVRES